MVLQDDCKNSQNIPPTNPHTQDSGHSEDVKEIKRETVDKSMDRCADDEASRELHPSDGVTCFRRVFSDIDVLVRLVTHAGEDVNLGSRNMIFGDT